MYDVNYGDTIKKLRDKNNAEHGNKFLYILMKITRYILIYIKISI